MKGDIAVAGFMMTAEEWQALDAPSRAQLVDVITRKDPQIATGSGPVVVERLASGTLPPANVAIPQIDGPELIEELPSGAVIIDPS